MLDITALKELEEQLRSSNDELELRVLDRTTELAEANEMMTLEIGERLRAEAELRETQERYRQLVEELPAVVYLWRAGRRRRGRSRELLHQPADRAPARVHRRGMERHRPLAATPASSRSRSDPRGGGTEQGDRDTVRRGVPAPCEGRSRGVGGGPFRDAVPGRAGQAAPLPGRAPRHHRAQGGGSPRGAVPRAPRLEPRRDLRLRIDPGRRSTDALPPREPADLRSSSAKRCRRWSPTWTLWLSHIHPDDRQRVVEESRRSRETGRPWQRTFRVIAQDGRVVSVLSVGRCVQRDADGTPRRFVGALIDVTASTIERDRLEAERAQLRSLVDGLPGFLWTEVVEGEPGSGRLTFVGPQVEEILGYTAEELLSDSRVLRQAGPPRRSRSASMRSRCTTT